MLASQSGPIAYSNLSRFCCTPGLLLFSESSFFKLQKQQQPQLQHCVDESIDDMLQRVVTRLTVHKQSTLNVSIDTCWHYRGATSRHSSTEIVMDEKQWKPFCSDLSLCPPVLVNIYCTKPFSIRRQTSTAAAIVSRKDAVIEARDVGPDVHGSYKALQHLTAVLTNMKSTIKVFGTG